MQLPSGTLRPSRRRGLGLSTWHPAASPRPAPDGATTTLAGSTPDFADGTGTAARFQSPNGVAVSPDGGTLYVADYSNHRIRKIDTSGGETTTLAGSTSGSADGTGTAASFEGPASVAVSSDGGTVYVADYFNNRIRKIDTSDGATRALLGTKMFSVESVFAMSVDREFCQERRVLAEGETLFVAGDQCDARWFLKQGACSVTDAAPASPTAPAAAALGARWGRCFC